MEWTPSLTELNNLLAELYSTQGEIQRLVAMAGLPPGQIKLEGKAVDIWYNVITEAANRGRLNVLLGACIEDSGYVKLSEAYQNYLKEPPPRSAIDTPTEDYIPLPIQPILIGRDKEIKEFTELLRQPNMRLLTLTGPSGVGKTTLAKFLAASLAADFKHGVTFVKLASLSEPASLLSEIGNAMPDYKQTVHASLINFLREKQRLILLDNFETVISAASFVTQIIGWCSQVKVIATCQQPLATGDHGLLPFEQRRVLAPLSYPGAVGYESNVEPGETGAVQLFIERAEALKRKGGLARTRENMEAIAEICQAVNGLPLCIEIVASFISTFEPPQLSKILREDGFAQLDEEQQLNRAIEIRYASLSAAEQTLFRRFAIFVGWCSFEAVKQICGSSVPVVTTLRQLVNKSFVQSEGGRYQMLHVIREYAQTYLDDASEADALRVKYANYYLQLAEKVAPQLKTPTRKEHLYRLRQDYDNLRAIFQWSLEPDGHLQTGLALAGALFWYWNFLAYFREGQRQVKELLKLSAAQEPSKALASALYCDGGLTFLLGEYRDAQKQLTESVKVWRAVKDDSGLAYALIILGMVKKEIGEDLDEALQHEQESVRLLEGVDEWGHALALNDLGNVLVAHGEDHFREAREKYEQSRTKWEQLTEPWGLSLVLSNLSSLDCKERQYDSAEKLMKQALAIQLMENDKWGRAWSLKGIGEARLGLRDYAGAASNFYESFCLHADLGRKQLVAECLEGLAKVAAGLEQAERGAYLIGAAETLRKEAGSSNFYEMNKDYDALLNSLRSNLSPKEFETSRTKGQRVALEELQRQVHSLFKEWK